MLRKICAFPFKVFGVLFGAVFIVFVSINALIMGALMKTLDYKFDLLFTGMKAVNKDEDNSIIELVESRYGSGKAMQVSEILNSDDK